jgi:hypothetical protein
MDLLGGMRLTSKKQRRLMPQVPFRHYEWTDVPCEPMSWRLSVGSFSLLCPNVGDELIASDWNPVVRYQEPLFAA